VAFFLTVRHVLEQDFRDVSRSDLTLTVRLVVPRVHIVVVHRVKLEEGWQFVLGKDSIVPDKFVDAERSARDEEPPAVDKDLDSTTAALAEESKDHSRLHQFEVHRLQVRPDVL